MAVLFPLGMFIVATVTASAAQSYTAPGKCPDGRPQVQCKTAPCEVSQCPRYQNSTCVNDYCGGCFARYFVDGQEVTKFCASSRPATASSPPATASSPPATASSPLATASSPPLCPDGSFPVQCFEQPCRVNFCPAFPNATCVDDYCGGCNARFYVDNKEVTNKCPSSPPVCPDGSRPFQCFQRPCNVTTCSAFPTATCVDDYCGGCNARFYINKTEVTYKCCKKPPVTKCREDEVAKCVIAPCDPSITSCNNVLTAACASDVCVGCVDRWFLPDCSEVTSICNKTAPAS